MIRGGLVRLAVLSLVAIVATVAYVRLDQACLVSGEASDVKVTENVFAIGGRGYRVSLYVNADYGAYLFPGGLFRGHPVNVAVDISADDDAAMPEIRPQCIHVRHDEETLARSTVTQRRVDIRTDLTSVEHVTAGTKGGLPDWAPDGTVHVWVRVQIADRAYLLDLGDSTIHSVARVSSRISMG